MNLNLLQLEIPDRCRRFSERVGPFLPFIAAAVVLAAVQALPADRRCLIRGHIQDLRRHHRDDAPVELFAVLQILADVVRDPARRRRAREDRRQRERDHQVSLAGAELARLLAFNVDAGSLVPGMEQVELSTAEWEALV